MLWRATYETTVLDAFEDAGPMVGSALAGPPFDARDYACLIAAFDTRALREVEVWRRLIEDLTDAPQAFALALIKQGWTSVEAQLLRQLFPPSLHGKAFLLSADVSSWKWNLGEPGPERAFAWIPSKQLAMVGPPTEEAWERFSNELVDVLNRRSAAESA